MQKTLTIFTEDREKIEGTSISSGSALIVHHYLQRHPIIGAKKIMAGCKISLPTANKALQQLIHLGSV